MTWQWIAWKYFSFQFILKKLNDFRCFCFLQKWWLTNKVFPRFLCDVWKTAFKMEGGATSAGTDLMHICHWRKPHRFFGQTHYAPVWHRSSLALHSCIYYSDHADLAVDGISNKHPVWPVPVLWSRARSFHDECFGLCRFRADRLNVMREYLIYWGMRTRRRRLYGGRIKQALMSWFRQRHRGQTLGSSLTAVTSVTSYRVRTEINFIWSIDQ